MRNRRLDWQAAVTSTRDSPHNTWDTVPLDGAPRRDDLPKPRPAAGGLPHRAAANTPTRGSGARGLGGKQRHGAHPTLDAPRPTRISKLTLRPPNAAPFQRLGAETRLVVGDEFRLIAEYDEEEDHQPWTYLSTAYRLLLTGGEAFYHCEGLWNGGAALSLRPLLPN